MCINKCESWSQWDRLLAPFFFKQPREVDVTASHADEETRQDRLSELPETSQAVWLWGHDSQVGKKWADQLELK